MKNRRLKKIFSRALFVLLFVSVAFASTAGPTLVGTGADGGGGAVAWVNPGNITAVDGVFATCTATAPSQNCNFLNGTMGANAFSVPAGSTINGIQVDISRFATIATDILESSVKALKGGVSVGTSQGTGTFLPTVQTTATYGGPGNLWGTTWTPADVNAGSFGVQFQDNITSQADSAQVDWIKITVTFTPPAGCKSCMFNVFARNSRPQTRTQTRSASIVR